LSQASELMLKLRGGLRAEVSKMFKKLFGGARAVLHKDEVERDMDQEVRFHLEMEIQQNIRRGMSPSQARLVALRSFGGVEQVKEQCRDE
jgi:hypothetical protein